MAALLYRFNILSASKSTRGSKEEEAEKATKNPIPPKKGTQNSNQQKVCQKFPKLFQRPSHTSTLHSAIYPGSRSLSLPVQAVCSSLDQNRARPDHFPSGPCRVGPLLPPSLSLSLSPPRRPRSSPTRPHATRRLLPFRSGRAAYIGLGSIHTASFRFVSPPASAARAHVREGRGG